MTFGHWLGGAGIQHHDVVCTMTGFLAPFVNLYPDLESTGSNDQFLALTRPLSHVLQETPSGSEANPNDLKFFNQRIRVTEEQYVESGL